MNLTGDFLVKRGLERLEQKLDAIFYIKYSDKSIFESVHQFLDMCFLRIFNLAFNQFLHPYCVIGDGVDVMQSYWIRLGVKSSL